MLTQQLHIETGPFIVLNQSTVFPNILPTLVCPELIFCCSFLKLPLTCSLEKGGLSLPFSSSAELSPLPELRQRSEHGLHQCFSNCNVLPNYLGILLKCTLVGLGMAPDSVFLQNPQVMPMLLVPGPYGVYRF